MGLNSFKNNVVSGWIKRDLERMLTEISIQPGQMGNINFPLALSVLAYMEYLGGFLLGADRGFAGNVTAYISTCFSNPAEYPIPLLRDVFRNGLAHEYFARGGISRDGLHPSLYRNSSGEVILDAQSLVSDFLNSLETYKNSLTETKFRRRLTRAEQTITDWKSRYSVLINSLPQRRPTSTHSRSSGASVYPGQVNTTTLPYDPNEE